MSGEKTSDSFCMISGSCWLMDFDVIQTGF